LATGRFASDELIEADHDVEPSTVGGSHPLLSDPARTTQRSQIMATHSKSADAIPTHDASIWAMTPPSTDLLTKAYAAWLYQANKVNDEALRFAHDRLAKDLEAASHIVRCSEPNEAFTVQMEFASNMAVDYLHEGQKMLELVSQFAKETRLEPGQNTRGRHHS
jgi:Phasin protein